MTEYSEFNYVAEVKNKKYTMIDLTPELCEEQLEERKTNITKQLYSIFREYMTADEKTD